MIRFMLHRLLWGLVVVWFVATAVFAMFFVAPHDVARLIAGRQASEQTLQLVRHRLGLDERISKQYVRFLGRLVTFDMGLNNDRASLEQYIASNKKFQAVAKQAGADIILSNHTDWDRSKVNLPMMANRAAGTPNPYVTNNASVLRYLKVAEECATAKVMRLN